MDVRSERLGRGGNPESQERPDSEIPLASTLPRLNVFRFPGLKNKPLSDLKEEREVLCHQEAAQDKNGPCHCYGIVLEIHDTPIREDPRDAEIGREELPAVVCRSQGHLRGTHRKPNTLSSIEFSQTVLSFAVL